MGNWMDEMNEVDIISEYRKGTDVINKEIGYQIQAESFFMLFKPTELN
jgi:hypothetical protein